MVQRKALGCVSDLGIITLAEDLRTLSDPNRLRMMCLLLGVGVGLAAKCRHSGIG